MDFSDLLYKTLPEKSIKNIFDLGTRSWIRIITQSLTLRCVLTGFLLVRFEMIFVLVFVSYLLAHSMTDLELTVQFKSLRKLLQPILKLIFAYID